MGVTLPGPYARHCNGRALVWTSPRPSGDLSQTGMLAQRHPGPGPGSHSRSPAPSLLGQSLHAQSACLSGGRGQTRLLLRKMLVWPGLSGLCLVFLQRPARQLPPCYRSLPPGTGPGARGPRRESRRWVAKDSKGAVAATDPPPQRAARAERRSAFFGDRRCTGPGLRFCPGVTE